MAEIWDDRDVSDIISRTPGGQPDLRLGDLDDAERSMLFEFIAHDERVSPQLSAQQILDACLVGIRIVEHFPDTLAGTNALGWKKFMVYMTAANAQILWETYEDGRASAVGGWVLETLSALGVQPDGFATALGTAYSATMAIHGSAVVRDPVTDEFVTRGGADGRRLAGLD